MGTKSTFDKGTFVVAHPCKFVGPLRCVMAAQRSAAVRTARWQGRTTSDASRAARACSAPTSAGTGARMV